MFERGARACANVFPNFPYGIFCPLCTYFKSDVSQITAEHVPQRCIGGRILCLTCRQCNSDAGHKFEHMLPNELIVKNGINDAPIRGSWEQGGTRINGDISFSDNTLKLETISSINNPNNLKIAIATAKELPSDSRELNISINVKYNKQKADIAYLKSAYLALFAKYGYNLIRHPVYNRIRNQIRNPNQISIQRYRFHLKDNSLPEFAIIASVSPVQAIYIKIKNNLIALPDGIEDGDSIYDWYASNEATGSDRLNFDILAVIKWPVRMELKNDFK